MSQATAFKPTKFVTAASVLLLGLAVSKASALADPLADASWLFIQTAPAGEFDGTTLTLSDINPSITMFTDRPARAARMIGVAEFVEGWSKGGESFRSDPPNAGVTGIVDGKLQTATVELTEPAVSGTSLSYKVKLLEGELPKSFSAVSVFIDDIPWNPGGF
jgi:hypothetical protein